MADSGWVTHAAPAEGAADVAARKAALRTHLLAARRALPGPVRAAAAQQVQAAVRAALREVLAGRGPLAVAGYVPIGAEPGGPDLPAVLARELGPGGRVLLPVLRDDRELDWAAFAGDPVPAGPHLGPAAIGTASLVVVPALAVDHRGVRLGRGGGGYDRALARVPPDTPVVALLHDGELVREHLPVAPHDRRVSAAVTPALGLVQLRDG